MNVGGVSELKAESDLHERVSRLPFALAFCSGRHGANPLAPSFQVGREVYEAILNLELGITVEATAAICAKIDTCPEARFYVISADNGAVPILHLIDTAPPESLAAVVSLINKIVDSNAQALEHLALVGLIPKVAVHVSSEVALVSAAGAWRCDAIPLPTLIAFVLPRSPASAPSRGSQVCEGALQYQRLHASAVCVLWGTVHFD
jgi:hypothetical protein